MIIVHIVYFYTLQRFILFNDIFSVHIKCFIDVQMKDKCLKGFFLSLYNKEHCFNLLLHFFSSVLKIND